MVKRNYARQNQYIAEKYDRIALVVPKGDKEKIKQFAESNGEKLNGFINRAIRETMERDKAQAGD